MPPLDSTILGTAQPAPHTSDLTFPDGGRWRIEIASVEGPAAFEAVLDEARALAVPVHRVSQGSGVMMLTDREIDAMVALGRDADVEVCLFIGPRASWDIGGQRFTPSNVAARCRGRDAMLACVAEAERAAELGVGSVLVADEGVLWLLDQQRRAGRLPADMQFKVSVLAAPSNPAAFALSQRLGADTVNVPSDLTLAQLAELRSAATATIDFYVEAPDSLGGFVRLYDVAELVRVASPIYLKFGLRNAPDIYPSGGHLAATVLGTARERVRRARLALDMLERLSGPDTTMSKIGARDQPAGPRFGSGA